MEQDKPKVTTEFVGSLRAPDTKGVRAIEIRSIWLIRRGGESDPLARVEVHVETAEGWHLAIVETLGTNFSHCVHAEGIRQAPPSEVNEWGES